VPGVHETTVIGDLDNEHARIVEDDGRMIAIRSRRF
jgi:hypothetical protein